MAQRPALVVVLALLTSSPTWALESPLSSGMTFPDLVGKSLWGSDLTVRMRDGQPKVVVITFTRAGATPAQAWLDACRADETAQDASAPSSINAPAAPLPRVACWDVRMAQEIPRIMRGFIEGRMKKGVRPEQLARTLLVYKDEEVWRDRLLVMQINQDEPFIVMVDRQGRVQSLLQGSFNPAALKAEQAKLLGN